MDVKGEIKENADRGALKLFATYRSSLFAMANDLCGDATEADDLTMRTLERALAHIDSFDEEKGRVIDWMRAIMRNLYKNDIARKAANAVVATDPDDLADLAGAPSSCSTEEEIFRKSDDEYLRRAIDSLQPELREAVVLHYLMEQPIAQVARVLRVPVGTVKARLHYARRVLEGKLVDEMKKPRSIVLLALCCLSALTYAAFTSGWLPFSSGEGPMENLPKTEYVAQTAVVLPVISPTGSNATVNSVATDTNGVTRADITNAVLKARSAAKENGTIFTIR